MVRAKIERAPMINGGQEFERALNEVLEGFDMAPFIVMAMGRLEQRAREAAEVALAQQNERRAAIGLAPLTVAEGEAPQAVALPMEGNEAPKAPDVPPPPYRAGNRASRRAPA